MESLWWKSRRASATWACARATFTRAFSLFLLPFCLRDRSRCARLSFFSARRRNRGAADLGAVVQDREVTQAEVDPALRVRLRQRRLP